MREKVRVREWGSIRVRVKKGEIEGVDKDKVVGQGEDDEE